MKSTKVLYLVLGSAEKEHQLDEITQRNTWAQDLYHPTIWLKGAGETSFDVKNRNLFVNIKESYMNILEKTRLGIEWCANNLDFDYLVRGNVSTYFRTEKIKEYLSERRKEGLFLGGYIDVFNDAEEDFKINYVNGGAIFMNRESALEIIRMNTQEWKKRPDDVALSEYLQSRGARLTWIPRGNISNTLIFEDRIYFRLKSSPFALMASKRMYHLHKIYSTREFLKKKKRLIKFYSDEFINFNKNFASFKAYFLSIYSVLANTLRFRKYS